MIFIHFIFSSIINGNIIYCNMITDKILNEVIFKAARSGGKGGQNVNKVSTKVELYFNIYDSFPVLSVGTPKLNFRKFK